MASKTTLIKASVRKEIIERNVFSYYDNIPWINCEERGHDGIIANLANECGVPYQEDIQALEFFIQ